MDERKNTTQLKSNAASPTTKLSQPTTEMLAPKHPSLLPIYPADTVKITSVSSTYQVVIKKKTNTLFPSVDSLGGSGANTEKAQ